MGQYSKLEKETDYPYQADQNRCTAPHGPAIAKLGDAWFVTE